MPEPRQEHAAPPRLTMDFRDEIDIEVRAGRGGDGIVSFRREKFVPRGGPDGGDGGKGGDVVFVTTPHVRSLLALGRRPRYEAQKGEPGGPKSSSGHGGRDLVLEVPVGTQVFERRRGNLLRDLSEPGQRLVIARGGAGGRGNIHFATAVRQAPREATQGREGEHLELHLELKIFAEVGLLGLPNAGKSTFLSAVTAARPKIADYPFTTLVPQVGIARVREYDTLVLADLPGLVEGAAEGRGLGHRFLKHVERCSVLLQLVDVSAGAATEPAEAFRIIDAELERASPELWGRARVVAATKVEDAESERRAAQLFEAIGAAPGAAGTAPADAGAPREGFAISAQTGRGVPELLGRLHAIVRAALETQAAPRGEA